MITCHWSRRVMRKMMMESANRSQAGSRLYDLSIYSHEQTHKVPTSSGGPGSHTQHRVFTQLSLALHQLLLVRLIANHLLPPKLKGSLPFRSDPDEWLRSLLGASGPLVWVCSPLHSVLVYMHKEYEECTVISQFLVSTVHCTLQSLP